MRARFDPWTSTRTSFFSHPARKTARCVRIPPRTHTLPRALRVEASPLGDWTRAVCGGTGSLYTRCFRVTPQADPWIELHHVLPTSLPFLNDGGMQAKLWDLESFEMVASYVDSTPVQAVTFHGDGNHVITATQDHVKVRALYAAVRGFGSEQGGVGSWCAAATALTLAGLHCAPPGFKLLPPFGQSSLPPPV